MKIQRYNSLSGFTLIELLIVLAIAGILITTAIPAFSNLLASNQQISMLHSLYRDHQLARSEAIKTNRQVLVCKSNDGQKCTPEVDWHDGWIIFSDTDHNEKINNNERIIAVQQALGSNLTLKYKGFGSYNYIRYYPDGHSTSNGTFTLCNQFAEANARTLIISRTGRARIDNKAAKGKVLSCS